MKAQRILILFLVCASLFFSCSDSPSSTIDAVIFQPKYATGFRVVKSGNDTIIQFLSRSHSLSVSDSLSVSLSLSLSKINPARIALLSTTHSYYVNALNEMKNVSGVTYSERIQIPALQNQIQQGITQNLTRNGEVILEDLMALNPSVLFSVPFEPTQYQSKLPNCTVIPTAEYLEEHPLGKAEWIYVFGYVLRKQEMARELFAEIEREYLDSSKDSTKEATKVFFAANNGSDWTVASNNSYWSILLKDAGAEYVGGANGKGNVNFDKERMLFALKEADVYGELVYFPNTTNVSLSTLHPEFMQTNPFQHKKIFICNAANNGFFDKALLEPHVLLRELKQVLADSTFSGSYFQHTY